MSQGGLSQEIGISNDSPYQNSPGLPISGSFYHDGLSMLQSLSSYASRDSHVREKLSQLMWNMYKEAMVVVKSSFPMNNQAQSNYLDLFPNSDNRKKDVRLRSAGEPRRDKKKVKANEEANIRADTSQLNM